MAASTLANGHARQPHLSYPGGRPIAVAIGPLASLRARAEQRSSDCARSVLEPSPTIGFER